MRAVRGAVPGVSSSQAEAAGRWQLVGCSGTTSQLDTSSTTARNYLSKLLGLWDLSVGLLREVLLRLEHLSARHGGGAVVCSLRVDLFTLPRVLVSTAGKREGDVGGGR
jgi:hypothetical protein